MIEAIQTRLTSQVPALKTVEGAAEFSHLMKTSKLPHRTPAAHVIPLSLQGGAAQAATSQYIQSFKETVGVMLTLRSNDATGAKALVSARSLIFDCITALAGWTPNNEIGVFELVRSNLINMSAEGLVYQIEFSIEDEVRIIS